MDCPRLVLPTPGGPTKQGSARGPRGRVGVSRLGVRAPGRLRAARSPPSIAGGLGRPASPLLAQLLDREVLQDAVLDLLEIVVVLVQDLGAPRHVDLAAGQLAPGQARHPVQVGPDDAVLRRGRRDGRQAAQLALGLAAGLLGQAGLLDPLAQLGRLPSGPLRPALCWIARSCSRRKNSRWALVIRSRVSVVIFWPSSRTASSCWSSSTSRRSLASAPSSSSSWRASGEERDGGRDEIHHLARVFERLGGRHELVRQLVAMSTSRRKTSMTARCEGLDLVARLVPFRRLLDPGHQVRLSLEEVEQPDPLNALDHQPQGTVLDADKLVDRRRGADPVESVRAGRLGRSRRGCATTATSRSRRITSSMSPDRALLAHRQWGNDEREDHRPTAQRQDRQHVRDGRRLRAGVSAPEVQRPSPTSARCRPWAGSAPGAADGRNRASVSSGGARGRQAHRRAWNEPWFLISAAWYTPPGPGPGRWLPATHDKRILVQHRLHRIMIDTREFDRDHDRSLRSRSTSARGRQRGSATTVAGVGRPQPSPSVLRLSAQPSTTAYPRRTRWQRRVRARFPTRRRSPRRCHHAPAATGDSLVDATELQLAAAGIGHDLVAVVELATKQLDGQRLDDLLLDRALQRARAVDRVEALDGEELLGRVGVARARSCGPRAARAARPAGCRRSP